MEPRPCQFVNGSASSGIVEQEKGPKYEALARSVNTGNDNGTYGPNEGRDSGLKEGTPHCARQEMVYAGDAHCAALAKLLQEARVMSL